MGKIIIAVMALLLSVHGKSEAASQNEVDAICFCSAFFLLMSDMVDKNSPDYLKMTKYSDRMFLRAEQLTSTQEARKRVDAAVKSIMKNNTGFESRESVAKTTNSCIVVGREQGVFPKQ